MASKLVNVPITNAINPNKMISEFLMINTAFAIPDFIFTKTSVSIKAGSASPSSDKHRAPNNEMNRPNFGIATANKTTGKQN